MTDTQPIEQELGAISAQALQELLGNLTQAKQFAIEQAPEFCQQLVTRGMVIPAISAAGFALLAIAAVALFYLFVRVHLRGEKEGHFDAMFDGGLMAATSGIFALVFFVAACHSAQNALSVYIAPKVFLVEQITRMVR